MSVKAKTARRLQAEPAALAQLSQFGGCEFLALMRPLEGLD